MPVPKLSFCLYSGGAWHGAVQVPVVLHLIEERKRTGRPDYDARLCVSVGCANGVTDAQGDFRPVATDLWGSLDDRSPIDGIKDFLAPAIMGGKGFYKLDPLRRKQLQRIPPDGSKLRSAIGCGITIRQTGKYETPLFLPPNWKSDDPRGPLLRAAFGAPRCGIHDAMIASMAIAPIMEPVVLPGATACDGGHVHVLPHIPDSLLPYVGEIDALFCKPITHTDIRATKDVDGICEAALWAVEMQMEQTRIHDFAWLRSIASTYGIKVRVFAPPSVHGGMLDARREDIEARYALGEQAWSNPIIF